MGIVGDNGRCRAAIPGRQRGCREWCGVAAFADHVAIGVVGELGGIAQGVNAPGRTASSVVDGADALIAGWIGEHRRS
ncbi:hypothetical protein D3C71_1258780 [compost metagenome]